VQSISSLVWLPAGLTWRITVALSLALGGPASNDPESMQMSQVVSVLPAPTRVCRKEDIEARLDQQKAVCTILCATTMVLGPASASLVMPGSCLSTHHPTTDVTTSLL